MGEPEVIIADRGPLTRREAEAVLWVAQGKTSWEAGRILGVSEHTLSAHIVNASTKLCATNRAHLVARAFVHGVLAIHRHAMAIVLSITMAACSDPSRRPPRTPRRGRDDNDCPALVAT